VLRGTPRIARLDIRPMGRGLALGCIEGGTAARLFGRAAFGADTAEMRQAVVRRRRGSRRGRRL
jgi:hypothetical protein